MKFKITYFVPTLVSASLIACSSLYPLRGLPKDYKRWDELIVMCGAGSNRVLTLVSYENSSNPNITEGVLFFYLGRKVFASYHLKRTPKRGETEGCLYLLPKKGKWRKLEFNSWSGALDAMKEVNKKAVFDYGINKTSLDRCIGRL